MRWLLAAAASGIIAGQLSLDYIFPERPALRSDCCEGWSKCPNRKIVKIGRHRMTWWCGPERAPATVPTSTATASK